MDDNPEPCASCNATKQVTWSPVFSAHLCASCLHQRSYQLLDAKVTPLPVRDET